MKYRLFFDLKVFIAMQALPRRVQNRLAQHFERLQISPEILSVDAKFDDLGRRIEISVCDQFAVHYWIDHADRDIKILELHTSSGRSSTS